MDRSKARDDELVGLVHLLASEGPRAKKADASRQLVGAGKAAIPILIGALNDGRIYETRDIANRMNLPPNAPAPQPRLAKITVGERCGELLYRIVIPVHASPYAGAFKVFSEQILRVADWNAWWAASSHKSLDEIHAELTPLVDEYWKQHGTTQNVQLGEQPAEWEQGFPIPRGARKSGPAGGATSLASGRNYTTKIYEVDAGMGAMTAFYARYLPGASRSSEGQVVRFSKADGSVQLAPSGRGTRITLVLGPR